MTALKTMAGTDMKLKEKISGIQSGLREYTGKSEEIHACRSVFTVLLKF
ncbi:MAG: hypothetical protein R2941_00345 [Desulfobacterales bacterium]